MYVAVGDIKYRADNVVLGKSKHLDGKSMGLTISDLTIAQYADDVQLATQMTFPLADEHPRFRSHALLSHYGHEASFMQLGNTIML